MSEDLGSELRNLSLYLHNEKGLTKEALTLVNAMKPIFAELGVLSDQFDLDASTLNNLLKGKKESEEIVAELDALQKDAENVKSAPSQIKVNDFVARIKKLNQRLKTFDIDAETKTKVRENLCLLGRGTAIELHNTKHQTAYALTVAKVLVEEFGDLTSLRAKLNEDVTTLNNILNNLKTKNTVILIRQDWFIVDWYKRAVSSTSNYLDQARFRELKRMGDQALAKDDIDQLRTVLFELLSIQIHSDSGEGMFDIANIVKG